MGGGRRSRGLAAWLGWIIGAAATGYVGYVSVAGSRRLLHPDRRALEPQAGLPATPADLGLAYEDVRFTTDDGVTLSGWFIPADRPTRSAVVIMHGFTGHRLGELAAFVPWLQPEYNLLQFDFRGHGASGEAPITLGSRERLDVAAAVRFLHGRGLGPVALMGQSMGASVAILAAPDLPVAALVADAPFAELRNPVANRMRAEGYPLAGLGSRIIVAAASVRARARLLSPIARVAKVAPRGLLIIAPTDDRLIDVSQSLQLYEAAGEPKELFVVHGAEHATARWVAGREYERRVLSFLAQHL
jgi:alpha-beta hydrolase superfamily lysophospholipase